MAKPLVEVFIECPECKSELKVKVNKTRVNQPEKPEYDISTDIETVKQGTLFKGLKPKKAKVTKARKSA